NCLLKRANNTNRKAHKLRAVAYAVSGPEAWLRDFCGLGSPDHYIQDLNMSSFVSSTSFQKRLRIYKEEDLRVYNIAPGSRLQIERSTYSHWAIYVGDGKVCHLSVIEKQGATSSHASLDALYIKNAMVFVESFSDMMGGDEAKVYVNNAADEKWKPLPPEEIVARAESRKGQSEYGVLDYNCESFANWCRYDKTESDQAQFGLAAVKGTKMLILGGAALAIVALARQT
ncbi:hypothetical protein RRG08_061552, partial [Elysia crispata]